MNLTNWSLDTVDRVKKDKKLFTIDQANRSLVLLQRIVGDIVTEYDVLMELEELIETAEQTGRICELEAARQRLVTCVDTLQVCLEELDQLGVELRDFSRGIIDFPSSYNGRTISLCWLLGEPSVSHWHERSAGFACRQPISLITGKAPLKLA